jgi:hypothetical protein
MKKTKRPRLDPVTEIYRPVTQITPLPRMAEVVPGSPSSFFEKSFEVSVQMPSKSTSTILVHCHANGLCIITLPSSPSKYSNLCNIHYLVPEPPERSVTERRKRQSSLLSSRTGGGGGGGGDSVEYNINNKVGEGNTNSPTIERNSMDGIVVPSTPLVQLTWDDGTVETICAGIWGIIIERNDHLTPELIQRDATLDAYLAIVQSATGSFPPRSWNGPTTIVPPSKQEEKNV